MQKEDINILIVDDDASQAKAMSEALVRAGYKTLVMGKPEDVLSAVKFQPIHAAVIDCMLPKMNGRDLAKRLRQEISPTLPIVLVSGIYKDKNFAREAIQATGAHAFLTKPFDITDFSNTVESSLKDLVDVAVAPLFSLLTKDTVSFKERIRAINEAENVHGFDLPWIYSLLLHPRVNGHLNMITADGEVCGVGFQQGVIVQVNQEDVKSYFGLLLVEHGFISQEEIDEVMDTTAKARKMGERLVEANVLSPHAVQVVMADQQGIRLSKTVTDTSVKINFIETDEIKPNAHTDRTGLTELVNEWLMSKITLDWLKSFYMPWLQYNLKPGPEHATSERCLATPVVARVPGFMDALLAAETLDQALSSMSAHEEDHVYRAMHALLVGRVLRFGEQNASSDYDSQRSRLVRLNESLETQTHFERLGVSMKAKDAEVKRAYHELAKILHPDKLAPDAPADVRTLAKTAFEKIGEAYTVLSDVKAKATYLIELEKGRAEAVLMAEQLAEHARALLTKGDISKARTMLEEAVTLAPPSSEMKLLLVWAKLKAPTVDQRAANAAKDVLAAIPPEDRHNVIFYFVRGLMLKASGDIEQAKKSFETVTQQNPDFIDARRELSALSQANKPVDLLRGDLKDVVGLLFKKKK